MRIQVNGEWAELDSASPNVAVLVERLAMAGKRIAVELNGQIVPRSSYSQTALADGDRLEIVRAVGGG